MKLKCFLTLLLPICQRFYQLIDFFSEKNCNYNSCKFCYKFAFIPFLAIRRIQKQESNFQQVGGLVTRYIPVLCLQLVALYFKGMLNSIDFYKGIFLHVIPVGIIGPWQEVVAIVSLPVVIEIYLRLSIRRFVLVTQQENKSRYGV